jgi:AraC family ethanolamine operon transcriptional activator
VLSFGCVEQMSETLTRAGFALRLTQLGPGPLRGRILPLTLGPLQLLRVRFDRGLHSVGPKLCGRQICAIDLRSDLAAGPFLSHGEHLPPTSVFGLASTGDIHFTTHGRTDLALLVIDQARFLRLAAGLGGSALDEQAMHRNWLRIDPHRFERLRLYLRRLFLLAEESPLLLQDPEISRLAQEDLLPLLVESLAHGAGCQERLRRPPARIELVKLAQKWMDRHPDKPITLEVLCREVHAGRRTLIQGFREHLGMGPMAYLKLQRLHAVRRTLLAADPEQTTVAAEAARFGFLSAGHFSRDYHSLFGELPRETLAARLRA